MALRGNSLKRPRILFIVNEVAHYGEFKKILQSSLMRSRLDPIILFDRDGYDLQKMFSKEINDCRLSQFNYTVISEQTPAESSTDNRISLDKILIFLKIKFHQFKFVHVLADAIQFIKEILSYVRFFRNRTNKLKHFFKSQNINLVVLGEENILMDTFLYKKAFGSKPVIVYPYTIPNPKEMAGGAYANLENKSVYNLILKLIAPKFIRYVNKKFYLLIKPTKILAMKLVGYFPRNPWVLNSDTSDLVCLESEKMAELYVGLGVRKNHISVTGTFNDDIIYEIITTKEIRKKSFLAKYNLPNKPIVLVGFPPNQFPRPAAEHASYQELISSLAKQLTPFLKDFNIVISKHPRITESLDSLIKLGFIIASENTIELIPFSHIYIASASATIRWAIAAGVPVINYDMYRYHYEDYDSAKAVISVKSNIDFNKELQHILTDSAYYDDLVRLQTKASHQWSVLDGKVAERFVDLVTNLIEKRSFT